ncbi:MAG: bifunctional DNA primase/polymerase, partial [Rickettsiales bacterium]|nr:bifunctional DNA primase/polymerase [Rickettsiales bacterium]
RPMGVTGKVPFSILHAFRPFRSEAQVARWWKRKPHSNVMVRTGAAFRLAVLDVDDVPGMEETLAKLGMPPTLRVATGKGRGEHWYFLHPGDCYLPTIRNGVEGIFTLMADDEAGVVAPPSLHASGVQYRWLNPEQAIAPLPQALVEAVKGQANPESLPRKWWRLFFKMRYYKFPLYRAYYWVQDWRQGLRP